MDAILLDILIVICTIVLGAAPVLSSFYNRESVPFYKKIKLEGYISIFFSICIIAITFKKDSLNKKNDDNSLNDLKENLENHFDSALRSRALKYDKVTGKVVSRDTVFLPHPFDNKVNIAPLLTVKNVTVEQEIGEDSIIYGIQILNVSGVIAKNLVLHFVIVTKRNGEFLINKGPASVSNETQLLPPNQTYQYNLFVHRNKPFADSMYIFIKVNYTNALNQNQPALRDMIISADPSNRRLLTVAEDKELKEIKPFLVKAKLW